MTFKNSRGAEDMIPESFAKGTIMSLSKRNISHYDNAIDGLHFENCTYYFNKSRRKC